MGEEKRGTSIRVVGNRCQRPRGVQQSRKAGRESKSGDRDEVGLKGGEETGADLSPSLGGTP
eukprot:2364298-Rhodomonas_salina.4